MRIMHFVDTLEIGGAQRLLVVFARMAARHGVRMAVVSLREDNSPLAGELQQLGAEVVAFPAGWMLAPRRLWRLLRFVRQQRCDLIHAHLSYSIVVGAVVGKLACMPVIASLHSTGKEPKRRFAGSRQMLERWALRYGADRVIAVGKAVAEAHQEEVKPNHMVVVPNAVIGPDELSEDRRRQLRTELVGDPDRPILISVGRLTNEKGFDDLIRAFAEIRPAVGSAAVIIVGGGTFLAELVALVREFDLDGHVFLLGERQDVPELLAASDLFVLASRREGLPLSVLEAMAAGLPVVATDVGDVRQIVNEHNGLVVAPENPMALGAAIMNVLGRPDHGRALGIVGKERVDREYDPEAWFNRLMQLYEQVVAEKR